MFTTRTNNSFFGLLIAALVMMLVPTPQVAQAFPITLTGPCPGWKTLSWSGAGIGNMAIIVANGPGNFTLPSGPCAGTTLGLSTSGIQLVGIISTTGGTGSYNYFILNPAYCGRFVQCIKTDTCETSNVAGPL